ncbi:MAG: Co2+/Mg2+ efflux protein ApaG [Chloroflexaceae bacterium]|nr:Co2+/Mg2+ efflux protein ApaG [Chloroflexaceae bacterium]
MTRPFYYKETQVIRITVRPKYLPHQSYPDAQRYVFAYFVRIENVSKQTLQLRSRRWLIYDSIGEQHEVVGDGVVGEQPTLHPGDVHEYQSFSILKSSNGYMEGIYRFLGEDKTLLDAVIPRFDLQAKQPDVLL